MTRRAVWFLVAAVVMLSACASGSPPGGASGSLSGQDADLTSPPDPTVPYDGTEEPRLPAEPVAGPPVHLQTEDKWTREGTSSDRRQLDTDACYRFAWAQVDNDIRIDDDISSARNEAFSQNSRLTVHNQRVDSYYYEKERNARFEDCMRSKGYDLE